MTTPIRGVIAPNLTPFNDDMSIATDLYVANARRLIADGCAGLAPFGTTGEALSVGIEERIATIRAMIEAGVDAKKLIPGTGLTNVADTARLSRACLEMDCAGVMTLPPFYFKNVSDDGLVRYFAALVKELGEAARIYLYHIPQVAGVGIPPSVAARLKQEFPDQIAGIKDSSGVWENTAALLDIPGLIVYPGAELPLIEALDLGGQGCITATANLNAGAIAEVIRLYDAGKRDEAVKLHAQVKTFRMAIQGYAPIPAQKRLLAMATGDQRWAHVRPPLDGMDEAKGRELADLLAREHDFRAAA